MSEFSIKTKYISNKQFSKPWITPDIIKLIKAKSKMFNLLRLGIITNDENNAYKNRVKNILKKSKASYYKSLFNRNRNDIKKTWDIINNLCNNVNSNKQIKKILWNNVEYTDDQNIAEIFNEHFYSVAVVLEQNLGHCSQDPLNYLSNRTVPSFFLTPVTPGECSNLIKQLKNTKQSKDFIPVKMLISYHSFFLCSYNRGYDQFIIFTCNIP